MSIYGHGPSPQEQSILDLWEQRVHPRRIAARVNRPETYVRSVIARLGAPSPGTWEPAARHGSAMLLEALRRHHPERCGAAR